MSARAHFVSQMGIPQGFRRSEESPGTRFYSVKKLLGGIFGRFGAYYYYRVTVSNSTAVH